MTQLIVLAKWSTPVADSEYLHIFNRLGVSVDDPIVCSDSDSDFILEAEVSDNDQENK